MRPILAAALACSLAACERNADKATETPAERTATATSPAPTVLPPPATVTDPAIARGEALVAANCVRCHATRPGEISKHESAPSFATLFTHYPPEYLQEAFAEGVFVGHGDMPAFEFAPEQINDMVAYLKTLGPPPAAN
jgi:mono/diheme cytochrome c family protein